MKPVKFKEVNVTFAKNQPEYLPLPAFRDNGPEGEIITCWKLSWKERISLLISGRLWLSLLSFHNPLTPSFLTVKKSDLFQEEKYSAKS